MLADMDANGTNRRYADAAGDAQALLRLLQSDIQLPAASPARLLHHSSAAAAQSPRLVLQEHSAARELQTHSCPLKH
jgi:hypothetical protein